jgi:hypothetical protein
MGQHAHLAAMMRIMRNHVGQHGSARRPRFGPTVPEKGFHPALRLAQSFRKHF